MPDHGAIDFWRKIRDEAYDRFVFASNKFEEAKRDSATDERTSDAATSNVVTLRAAR